MSRHYIRGVDEPLPEGEEILWQGSPDTWTLARSAFRVRLLAGYFVALAAVTFLVAEPGTALPRATWILLLGAVAVALPMGYAWLTARHTVYALTDRRLVMRVGLAFPSVFNLPLDMVGDAWVRENKDGSGDLAIQIQGSDRIGYLFLWPHVRPRHLKDPQPMLRGLADVGLVGERFREAVQAVPRSQDPSRGRKPVRYSVFDDDGLVVLSNRSPDGEPQRA